MPKNLSIKVRFINITNTDLITQHLETNIFPLTWRIIFQFRKNVQIVLEIFLKNDVFH